MITFLTILKIFGIVVASLIGLVLLFIVLLLFLPFRYDAVVDYEEKKMKADVNVLWDARAVRVWYSQYPDGTHDGEALLFGIRLMRFDTDSGWLAEQIKKGKEWAVGICHGIMEAPEGPVNRLKLIYKVMTGPKWAVAASELRKRVKTIVLEVFPKFGKGNMIVGADDPYLTGQILEALAVLYPLYGKIIDVCPNFDRKYLHADLDVKGKVHAGKLLFNAAMIFFSKKSRMAYNELMRLTHNE